jgi:hypothetical protein
VVEPERRKDGPDRLGVQGGKGGWCWGELHQKFILGANSCVAGLLEQHFGH